jgi:hypothetical protein
MLSGRGVGVEVSDENHKTARLLREGLQCFGQLGRLRRVGLRDPVSLRHGDVHLFHAGALLRRRSLFDPPFGPFP